MSRRERHIASLTAFRRILAVIRLWRGRARSRQELRELNDHLLKDIDLRREDLGYGFANPPWFWTESSLSKTNIRFTEFKIMSSTFNRFDHTIARNTFAGTARVTSTADRLLADIRELAPGITARAVEIEAGLRMPFDLV